MTEDKDSICCSWYESCTYYMQCEHLYNENKDLSEDVYRLEQENKELKDNNNHLQVIIDDGRAENKRFREENKELKEKIKKYSAINEQDTKDYAILRNALYEIKKTIKSYDLTVDNGASVDTLYTIKNIINEVLQ